MAVIFNGSGYFLPSRLVKNKDLEQTVVESNNHWEELLDDSERISELWPRYIHHYWADKKMPERIGHFKPWFKRITKEVREGNVQYDAENFRRWLKNRFLFDFNRSETYASFASKVVGVDERHYLGEGETTEKMAAAAGVMALNDANLTSVDMIVVSSVTANWVSAPGIAHSVQYMLQNSGYDVEDAHTISLHSGCNGFTEGIEQVTKILTSSRNGARKSALVIGAEAMSTILDPNDYVQNAIFGDAAGAVVLTVDNSYEDNVGVIGNYIKNDGWGIPIVNVPSDGKIVMHPQLVGLYTSYAMPDAYRHAMKSIPQDARFPIFHQTGNRVVMPVAEELGFDTESLFLTYKEMGNTSSASTVVAYAMAMEQELIKPGDLVAFITAGVGMSSGATIVRMPYD